MRSWRKTFSLIIIAIGIQHHNSTLKQQIYINKKYHQINIFSLTCDWKGNRPLVRYDPVQSLVRLLFCLVTSLQLCHEELVDRLVVD